MSTAPLLAANGIRFAYDVAPVLEELDVEVRRGEILGIIGPNGCGKSTLLGILSGYLRPDRGTVLLGGRPVGDYRPRERARRLGHVSQRPESGFPYSVRELVEMGRYALEAPGGMAVEDALALMDIVGLAERPITRISGGELQRAWLARAWAADPECLLLDEPTAFLDLRHQVRILDALRRRVQPGEKAAAVVLHDLNLAAGFCDRLLLLDGGRVVGCGAPKEVLRYPVLKAVYGTEIYIGLLDGLEQLFVIPLPKALDGDDQY
ncbi:MAG: ABC transporter ATP-binding protein [Pseudomonadota bacterium]